MTQSLARPAKPELLTMHEVCDRLRITPSTLRYWRHQRQGPISFKMGGKIMFRVEDVDLWLANQYATTASGQLDQGA